MASSCRWLPLALSLVLAASCASEPPANVSIERRDLAIELLDDGSARVRDALTIRVDGPDGGFWRTIPAIRTDGFSDVVVQLDGTRMPETGATSATVDLDPDMRVRWRFPGAGGRHEVAVTYRASAVLFRSGYRARLEWPIAPLTPAMDVAVTTVMLTLPPGVSLYDGPRVEGEGWQASQPAAVTTYQRGRASAGEQATLVAEFSVDTFSIPEPLWQRHADREAELMPAWISGGLFVLVSGWGALYMLRIRQRSLPAAEAAAEQAAVARGLRAAGISIAIFGALCAAVVPWLLGTFGPWPYALPISIVIIGLWLIVAARKNDLGSRFG